MDDITQLILEDHEWFRERFAALDELQGQDPVDVDALRSVWTPLAERLDVHAIAEEEIFYPQLLRKGESPEDETLDAIGDHNDIRDAVNEANQQEVGSSGWWQAVGQARVSNDEHMAEEEREGLADFRRNAASGLREALGKRFARFMQEHPTTRELDTADKSPEGYVRAVEEECTTPGQKPERDESLGIGSLKGR